MQTNLNPDFNEINSLQDLLYWMIYSLTCFQGLLAAALLLNPDLAVR